jgi:hypothetical protein
LNLIFTYLDVWRWFDSVLWAHFFRPKSMTKPRRQQTFTKFGLNSSSDKLNFGSKMIWTKSTDIFDPFEVAEYWRSKQPSVLFRESDFKESSSAYEDEISKWSCLQERTCMHSNKNDAKHSKNTKVADNLITHSWKTVLKC